MVEEAPSGTQTVRAFVSLRSDRMHQGGGYRHIADVLSDDQLYQQMLRDSLSEIMALQQKYTRIRELKPVFDAAERVRSDVDQRDEGTSAAA